jgi:hypothetical protein
VSAAVGEQAGVIVVRVWLESDGRPRARITASDDLSSGEHAVGVASGLDEIVAAVRAWLERFVQRGLN